MTRVLFILFLMISTLSKGQEVKLKFAKNNSCKIRVDLIGQQSYKVNLGYDRNQAVVKVVSGKYEMNLSLTSYLNDTNKQFEVLITSDTIIDLDKLIACDKYLDEVSILGSQGSVFDKIRLKQVDGVAIYAGKKTEIVSLKESTANLSTNNGRQLYAKIAGLNIWESDAAGIQLGIGGRGLSPNRTSNFNTRQNGYDISADALGYPESYYAPVPDFIDRIEVVRGAASLQYGTQFGGMVNFKMKSAEVDGRLHASGKYTAGNNEFINLTHQISYGNKFFGVYAAHQYKKGNEFRDYSEFNSHSAFANLFFTPKKNIKIGVDLTKLYYVAQQPGGLTDDLFYDNPYEVLRKRNWFMVDWNMGALYADYYISENTRINTRFFGLMSQRKNVGYLGQINRPDLGQPRELIEGVFTNFGNETRFLTNYKIRDQYQSLLVGVRFYKGKTSSKQGLALKNDGADFNFLHPDDIDYSDYLFPSLNYSGFAENVFRLGKRITITPGIRFEYIDTRSQGYYYLRNYDLSGDTLLELKQTSVSQNARNFPLGGIGLSYKPFDWLETFANFSQNYRGINFSDIAIVNPNFKVDSNMKDETGYTVDAGIRGGLKNWLLFDVSAFYIAYNDRIGEYFKRDDFSFTVIRYRTNIGDSYNYGIESFVEIDAIKMFNDSSAWSLPLFANYSWIQALYNESEISAVEGNRVEFVPEHMLRLGATLKYKKAYLSYNYSFVSEQFTDATNASKTANAIFGTIPAYWVADISAGYSYKKFGLQIHVNNLTDNLYFTRRASGYPGPGIIPSGLRTFYFTLEFKF